MRLSPKMAEKLDDYLEKKNKKIFKLNHIGDILVFMARKE